jgi:hypothetical protein
MNHKPEIGVALGTPLPTIYATLMSMPELVQAIGDELVVRAFPGESSVMALRDVFATLLVRGTEWLDDIAAAARRLLDSIAERFAGTALATQFALARCIDEQYLEVGSRFFTYSHLF